MKIRHHECEVSKHWNGFVAHCITICNPNSDARFVVPNRPHGKRLDEQYQLTNLIFEVADTKSQNTTHRSKIGRTLPAPSRTIDDDDEEEKDDLWQGFWDLRRVGIGCPVETKRIIPSKQSHPCLTHRFVSARRLFIGKFIRCSPRVSSSQGSV